MLGLSALLPDDRLRPPPPPMMPTMPGQPQAPQAPPDPTSMGLRKIGENLDQDLGTLMDPQQQPMGPRPLQQQSQGLSSLLSPYAAATSGAVSDVTLGENSLADKIAATKGVDPSGAQGGAGLGNVGGILALAKTQIGVPYVFGSENPKGSQGGQGQAFDCSGFTKWLYAKRGVNLPHQALQQARMTGSGIGRNNLRPGDLVYFSYGRLGAGAIDHVMVYLGGGRAIGAQPSSNGVGIQPMNWSNFVGGGRVGGRR